jgi:hypothetical protein
MGKAYSQFDALAQIILRFDKYIARDMRRSHFDVLIKCPYFCPLSTEAILIIFILYYINYLITNLSINNMNVHVNPSSGFKVQYTDRRGVVNRIGAPPGRKPA